MKRAAPTREIIEALNVRRVTSVTRRASRYASSSPIEQIEARTRDGRRMNILFKDLSPAARLVAAREVRPAFVEKPAREIIVYRDILATMNLGTPEFIAAAADRRRRRYWLFIEYVRGPLLWQVGGLQTWCGAARWLARLHTSVAPRALTVRARAALLRCDRTYFRSWIKRAMSFAPNRPALEKLASRYDRVAHALADMPTVFAHGEFYPSNIIVRSGRRQHRICPIDWERAALAPAALDLAALTAGDWSARETGAMLRAYLNAAGSSVSRDELTEAVLWCQLHLAIQMLGWSKGWAAPRQHARDWLQIALRLARTLGVI